MLGIFYLLEVLIIIGLLCILAFIFFKSHHWVIAILFFLLLGNLKTLHIAGKTPDIFFADIFLAALVLVFFIKYLPKREKIICSKYPPYMIFFLAAGLLSLFNTLDIFRAIGVFRIFILGFLSFFFVINLVDSEEKIKESIYFLILFGDIIAVWMFCSIFRTGEPLAVTILKKNIHISWGHSNYLATFFVLLIPIAMGLVLYKQNKKSTSLYLIISLFLLLTGLIVTESRAGVIAAMISFLIFIIYTFRELKPRLVILIIAGILICILNPAFTTVLDRMLTLSTSSSSFVRVQLYKGAWETFLSHPFIGAGLGSLGYYMEEITGRETITAHNIILQFLGETGIIGVLSFLCLLFMNYRGIRKLLILSPKGSFSHLWGVGLFCGFIGVMIQSLFEPSFNGYQFFIFYWIIIGIAYKSVYIIRHQILSK